MIDFHIWFLKNWWSAIENDFLQAKIFFNFDLNKKCENEIKDYKGKFAIDSALPFTMKTILKSLVFTETIRRRGS